MNDVCVRVRVNPGMMSLVLGVFLQDNSDCLTPSLTQPSHSRGAQLEQLEQLLCVCEQCRVQWCDWNKNESCWFSGGSENLCSAAAALFHSQSRSHYSSNILLSTWKQTRYLTEMLCSNPNPNPNCELISFRIFTFVLVFLTSMTQHVLSFCHYQQQNFV